MSKSTILSEADINYILEQASNEAWEDSNYYQLAFSTTDVSKVSPETGLIFIKGDDNIGNAHILNRHNGWKKQFTKKYFPTLFDFDVKPINYHRLADRIYLTGVRVESKEDIIYEADLSFLKSMHSKFKLVLYRDTKIVKTMYPIAEEMQIRPNYEIGFVSEYTHNVKECEHVIKWRIFDKKEKARFILIVTYSDFRNTEVREIFIYKKNQQVGNSIYSKTYNLQVNTQDLPIILNILKFPEENLFLNNYIY